MRLFLIALAALIVTSHVPAWAADIGASSWSEVDGSNNAAPPAGWPAGMLPSQVEPTARAMMGATKRWFDHANCAISTAGSANAQTLSYAVAPAAYVAGDRYCFFVGTGSNTGPATLNINGLGAKAVITAAATVLTGGELAAGFPVEVSYDGSAFRIISSTTNSSSLVVGNLTVDSTKGAGQIGLDNNKFLVGKNTSGTYGALIGADNLNNLDIGNTTTIGQISLRNNGLVNAVLDTAGNWNIAGKYEVGGAQIACGNLSNAASSCATDTTNAVNISSGILPSARLRGPYTIGNLLVSNSFGGGGGSIGIDNNAGYQQKDSGGNYRSMVRMDGTNTLYLGDSAATGTIKFATNTNFATYVDGNGNYNFGHGYVGYISPSASLVNNTNVNTYFAAKDDGSLYVSSHYGGVDLACALYNGGGSGWGCTSDARLKTDVVPLGSDMAGIIMELAPVSFTWKQDANHKPQLGFLAQDVEQVFPQLVGTTADGTKTLDEAGLIAPLIAAVQAQQKRIDDLTNRLNALEAKALK